MRREELDKCLNGPEIDPMKLLELYDAFGQFGLPLCLSAVTLRSQGEGNAKLHRLVMRN